MAKAKTKKAYVCSDCGADFPRWQGQCNACNSWNTITEINLGTTRVSLASKASKSSGGYGGESSEKAINPSEVKKVEHLRFNTGVGEFDRVMGGGVTIGSATLISGSPGSGKTTLLTLLAALLSASHTVIYVTGEENQNQWKNRQDRVAPHYVNDNMFILVTDSLDKALEQASEKKSDICNLRLYTVFFGLYCRWL